LGDIPRTLFLSRAYGHNDTTIQVIVSQMSTYTTSGDLGHIAHPNDLLPIGGGLGAARKTNQVKGKGPGPTFALLSTRATCAPASVERDGVLILASIRLLELKLKCDRN
jgi:hypothetical protein